MKSKQLLSNMQVKLLKVKNEIQDIDKKVQFLLNDLSKLMSSEEDSNSEEFRENVV